MNSDVKWISMLQACDSLFPIGQFTQSNGLETFVLEEKLKNAEELAEYVNSYLSIAPFNDVLALILSFSEDIVELDNLVCAARTPEEIRTGSSRLAGRFSKMFEDIEPGRYIRLMDYKRLVDEGKCLGSYPIAMGLFAKDSGLDSKTAAEIFLYSQLSAIVTNAVKTVPLSQVKGQKILNAALGRVEETVNVAMELTKDDFGVGGVMFDIEAMRHQFLYSRQYMS